MKASIGVRPHAESVTAGSGAVKRLKRPPWLALETAVREDQPRRPGGTRLDPACG